MTVRKTVVVSLSEVTECANGDTTMVDAVSLASGVAVMFMIGKGRGCGTLLRLAKWERLPMGRWVALRVG